jgi:hypothetical protein
MPVIVIACIVHFLFERDFFIRQTRVYRTLLFGLMDMATHHSKGRKPLDSLIRKRFPLFFSRKEQIHLGKLAYTQQAKSQTPHTCTHMYIDSNLNVVITRYKGDEEGEKVIE